MHEKRLHPLAHAHGFAPLCMQPDENSDGAGLKRADWQDSDSGNPFEVIGGRVSDPDDSASGNQTSHPLLRANPATRPSHTSGGHTSIGDGNILAIALTFERPMVRSSG